MAPPAVVISDIDRSALCELPVSLTVVGVAEACRSSALDFLTGIARGWGKAELARWLDGRYRTLTRFALQNKSDSEKLMDALARCSAKRAEKRAEVSPRARLAPARIDELLQTTRGEVLEVLRAAAQPGEAIGFGFEAMGSGHVVRCIDRQGALGWVPVDIPRMRLLDRVVSLVAVDYLTRPDDYETKLVVCGRCDQIAFDVEARARGGCRTHADSTIVTKDGAPASRQLAS
jgi:hypothetical protein